MISCAEIIAKALKESGIKRIFGLPGGEILHLIEACRQTGIEFILTRHEATAAFMADVVGQITRNPGVCLSTVGPGATNLVTGVANAYLDRSPVLAISAQLSTSFYKYSPHQRIDLAELFKPVTKWSFQVSGRNTAGLIEKAIEIATAPRPGPVHISLPSDIAREEEHEFPEEENGKQKEKDGLPEGNLQKMADEIGKHRYPVVIVGIGVDPKEVQRPLRDFVEKVQIPVMVMPKAKGIIPEDHPLFLGTAGGMAGDRFFLEFMKNLDLLIGIGFDPVESDKTWHIEQKIISIDTASIRDQHFSPHLEQIGKVDKILTLLTERMTPNHRWKERDISAFKIKLGQAMTPKERSSGKGLSPYYLAQTMRAILSPDSILTVDVGAHKLLFGQVWKAYCPLTFFISNGLSSMGYGFPAALAAKLEFPEKHVVCVTGDGGFSMMIHDLETAVRLKLPVVVVVFSDALLSLIDCVQQKRGLPCYGVGFGRIDFAKVAQGFGANGVKVSTFSEFEATFQEALKAKEPTVIDVLIDPAEYSFQIQ